MTDKDSERGTTERTKQGHEVPIPKRGAFFANLKKIAQKPGHSVPTPGVDGGNSGAGSPKE